MNIVINTKNKVLFIDSETILEVEFDYDRIFTVKTIYGIFVFESRVESQSKFKNLFELLYLARLEIPIPQEIKEGFEEFLQTEPICEFKYK